MPWHIELDEAKRKLPFSFIPVEDRGQLASRIPLDSPIPKEIKKGAEARYFGKLHCILKVRGPFCLGNEQKDIDSGEKLIHHFKIGGKAAIPRSSLKGMIRGFYEAWHAVPMIRVASKRFWFRPNIAFGPRDSNRIGIVSTVDAEGLPESILVLPPLDYRRGDPSADIQWLRNIPQGIDIHTQSLGEYHVECRYATSGSYYIFPITNGVDGEGQLARWFSDNGHGYTAIKIRKAIVDTVPCFSAHVLPALKKNYRDLYTELVEAAPDHPLIKDADPSIKAMRLQSLRDSFEHVWKCTTGDILFLETRGKGTSLQLETFGRTFRYPWLNEKGTNSQDFPKDIKPILDGEDLQSKLAQSRELFGYAYEDSTFENGIFKNLGNDEKRKLIEKYRSKSGKVHFNDAIHMVGTGKVLNNQHLPRPGQPRPSFFPFTLSQNYPSTSQGNSDPIATFGDPLLHSRAPFLDEPRLAGRKRYRASTNVCFLTSPDKHGVKLEEVLSPDGDNCPKFKFTVSFDNLTSIEFLELLFSLDLGGDQRIVHQVGYGKEYGMGGVSIKIEETALFIFNKNGLQKSTERIIRSDRLKPIAPELYNVMTLSNDPIPRYPSPHGSYYSNLKILALKNRKNYLFNTEPAIERNRREGGH